jgi:hypothetical protein
MPPEIPRVDGRANLPPILPVTRVERQPARLAVRPSPAETCSAAAPCG